MGVKRFTVTAGLEKNGKFSDPWNIASSLSVYNDREQLKGLPVARDQVLHN